MPLAHGAIATRRTAVAIPVGIPLASLERFVADALHVIQAIHARVPAGLDAPLGSFAMATLAARRMALWSILWIVAVGVHVGIGGGFRVHLGRKRMDVKSSIDDVYVCKNEKVRESV